MKRLILLVPAVLALVFTGCPKAKTVVEREGFVNYVSGEVTIAEAGKTTKAKPSDVIKKGMKIMTGKNSSVEIYFGDNAIKLMENSEIQVDDLLANLNENSEKTSLRVNNGKLFSKIASKLAAKDEYLVTTKTAVAAVRGTDFMVSEEGDGKSVISCIDGKVEVKNETAPGEKSVEIEKNEEVVCEKNKPLNKRSIMESNRMSMRKIREDFEKMRDEIRKMIKDQKEQNRQMVEKLRKENKEMVNKRKAEDHEAIDKLKDEMKGKTEELKNLSDEQKNIGKDAVKDAASKSKEGLDKTKPEIKKFKSSID